MLATRRAIATRHVCVCARARAVPPFDTCNGRDGRAKTWMTWVCTDAFSSAAPIAHAVSMYDEYLLSAPSAKLSTARVVISRAQYAPLAQPALEDELRRLVLFFRSFICRWQSARKFPRLCHVAPVRENPTNARAPIRSALEGV
jgi:hypothetical protein